MIERITKITEGAEEITDVLTNSAGMIITRITPLLAPLASGFTVLFAFYDGGGRMLAAIPSINSYAHIIAFAVGFVLMMALEGINFSTTFNRDRAEKLKERYAKELSGIDADKLVSYAFWLTVAIVFGLETAPGIIGFFQQTATGSDLAFKTGLLILPFFSKIGAKIFSLAVILDGLEGTYEARRLRRLQAEREAVDLEIELQSKRQEAMLRLAQMEAESKQKLDIERLKAESKISNSVQRAVKSSDMKSVKQTVQSIDNSGVLDTNLDTTEQRLNALVDAILDTGWHGVTDIRERLNVSRQTVYNDLKVLELRNRIKVTRSEDGKIIDVSIVPNDLPVSIISTNGINHY